MKTTTVVGFVFPTPFAARKAWEDADRHLEGVSVWRMGLSPAQPAGKYVLIAGEDEQLIAAAVRRVQRHPGAESWSVPADMASACRVRRLRVAVEGVSRGEVDVRQRARYGERGVHMDRTGQPVQRPRRTVMTPQETADVLGIANVLDRAADIIERVGYRPYTFDGAPYSMPLDERTPVECAVCEVGAVALACGAQHGFPDYWASDAAIRECVDAAVMELATTIPDDTTRAYVTGSTGAADDWDLPEHVERLSDAAVQYAVHGGIEGVYTGDYDAEKMYEARTVAVKDDYSAMTASVVAHLRNTAIELRDQA